MTYQAALRLACSLLDLYAATWVREVGRRAGIGYEVVAQHSAGMLVVYREVV